MKKFLSLLLISIIVCLCSCTTSNYFNGTYVITDLKIPNGESQEMKEKMARRYLGTKIKLEIYDNTAVFSYLREKNPDRWVLNKINDNTYHWKPEDAEENEGITLKLNKSFASVKSINIIVNKDNGESILTAKRDD